MRNMYVRKKTQVMLQEDCMLISLGAQLDCRDINMTRLQFIHTFTRSFEYVDINSTFKNSRVWCK